ncbi:hypothetical protein EV359DRAFT_52073 [Lentinula novae-zelandiae]|nr:hypothetical protein EV359DRAFT_52073 [Lentinula novae-zelandiae]
MEKAPDSSTKQKVLFGRIHKQKWNSILYVCDNLTLFPDNRCPEHQGASKIVKSNATKEHLTNLLIDWRMNNIQERQGFIWPYFTPKNGPLPAAPWAPTHRPDNGSNHSTGTRKLSLQERSKLLKELGQSMNYTSAVGVGSIHRMLQQPLVPSELDELKKALKKMPGDSLAYVCTDIERLPCGEFVKDDMVKQLTFWVIINEYLLVYASDISNS